MAKKPGLGERACPKCKETIKVDAAICKHCRTEFSAEEIAAAKAGASKNKKAVGFGCLGIFVILVLIGAIADGDQGGKPVAEASETADGTSDVPEQGSAAPAVKAAAVEFYKSIFSNLAACDAAAKVTAEVPDRISAGSATMYDGYSAATAQVNACRESWSKVDKMEVPDALDGQAEEAAEKAKDTCANMAIAKQMGAETAQEIFDGDMKPSKLQEFKEQASTAQAGVIACAAATMDVALKAAVDLNDLPNAH